MVVSSLLSTVSLKYIGLPKEGKASPPPLWNVLCPPAPYSFVAQEPLVKKPSFIFAYSSSFHLPQMVGGL